MIGGANTDHVAEGHCEGEGAGGEAPFYKVNGKLNHCNTIKNGYRISANELLCFYCLTCLQLDFHDNNLPLVEYVECSDAPRSLPIHSVQCHAPTGTEKKQKQ